MTWIESVNQHTVVGDLLAKHPELSDFLNELGYRESCRDCALTALAHRIHMKPDDLVARVNAFLWKGGPGESAL